jgi:hypothetical protein
MNRRLDLLRVSLQGLALVFFDRFDCNGPRAGKLVDRSRDLDKLSDERHEALALIHVWCRAGNWDVYQSGFGQDD